MVEVAKTLSLVSTALLWYGVLTESKAKKAPMGHKWCFVRVKHPGSESESCVRD